MSEIVNLKRVRKARARKDAAALADANRRWFGQTKAERGQVSDGKARAARRLDGHLLLKPDES